MQLAILASAVTIAVLGGTVADGAGVATSEVSKVTRPLRVASSSTPALTSELRGARIGERSILSVASEPGARRVIFYVDDPRATRPGIVTTRGRFALGRGSRAGLAALTPGRHVLTAKVEFVDGRIKTFRAPYTVARLYLAPTGSNSNPCTQTRPCQSIARAYAAAPPGGIVEMADGAYGCEPIFGNRQAPVTVRPADGALPQTTCPLEIHAPWLRLEELRVSGAIAFLPGANNSSFADGAASNFSIFGADDVTISGSTFDGNGHVSNNQIWDAPAGSTPDRFRIVGNTIENFYGPTDDAHSEGIYVGYSTDGLIADNTFSNNGNTAHIFFTWFGSQADPATSSPRDICVRGNRFGPTHGAYWAVSIRGEIGARAGIRIARPPSNTVLPGVGLSTAKDMLGSC